MTDIPSTLLRCRDGRELAYRFPFFSRGRRHFSTACDMRDVCRDVIKKKKTAASATHVKKTWKGAMGSTRRE